MITKRDDILSAIKAYMIGCRHSKLGRIVRKLQFVNSAIHRQIYNSTVQFVRCEYSHWNTRGRNNLAGPVQFIRHEYG